MRSSYVFPMASGGHPTAKMQRTAYQPGAAESSVMIGMLPRGMPGGSKPALKGCSYCQIAAVEGIALKISRAT